MYNSTNLLNYCIPCTIFHAEQLDMLYNYTHCTTAQVHLTCQGLPKRCRRLYSDLDLFNLSLANSVHVYEKGDTLQKKETEYRGYGLSLTVTAAKSSMTTAFAGLKHVQNLCNTLFAICLLWRILQQQKTQHVQGISSNPCWDNYDKLAHHC
jgi:hypothetical protein